MDRDLRKKREGVVVSDKMNKTVVVSIERHIQHPEYKRVIVRTKRVKAHVDDGTQCKVGDKVQIMETRPLSKEKRWRVLSVCE